MGRRLRTHADAFGQRSIDYRHNLPELAKKPQALRQVLPELLRDLGEPFPAVWAHFHTAHPDRETARLFAKVLGQIETHGLAAFAATAAQSSTTGSPVLVAVRSTPAVASARGRRGAGGTARPRGCERLRRGLRRLIDSGAGISAATLFRDLVVTHTRPTLPGLARAFEGLALSAELASRHESVFRQRLREARFPEPKTSVDHFPSGGLA
jgi:hypothetical protein